MWSADRLARGTRPPRRRRLSCSCASSGLTYDHIARRRLWLAAGHRACVGQSASEGGLPCLAGRQASEWHCRAVRPTDLVDTERALIGSDVAVALAPCRCSVSSVCVCVGGKRQLERAAVERRRNARLSWPRGFVATVWKDRAVGRRCRSVAPTSLRMRIGSCRSSRCLLAADCRGRHNKSRPTPHLTALLPGSDWRFDSCCVHEVKRERARSLCSLVAPGPGTCIVEKALEREQAKRSLFLRCGRVFLYTRVQMGSLLAIFDRAPSARQQSARASLRKGRAEVQDEREASSPEPQPAALTARPPRSTIRRDPRMSEGRKGVFGAVPFFHPPRTLTLSREQRRSPCSNPFQQDALQST